MFMDVLVFMVFILLSSLNTSYFSPLSHFLLGKTKGNIPSFKIIADYLSHHINTKNKPDELARIIKQSSKVTPVTLPPKQTNSTKEQERESVKGHLQRKLTENLPLYSCNIQKHDPRVFTENLPKCPHGVLKVRKCAICDPDGFRLDYGWDH